jgi:hypothetical protein
VRPSFLQPARPASESAVATTAVPRSRAVAVDAAVEAPTIAEISNAVGTSGGKLKTSEEIRVLIRRVAQATKYWSASKIHRENGVRLPCACGSATVQR